MNFLMLNEVTLKTFFNFTYKLMNFLMLKEALLKNAYLLLPHPFMSIN